MQLCITRFQWPVGHGCFSSGHLCAGKERFNYIYDCGSKLKITVLSNEVAAYLAGTDTIDALFLSHMDDDHVNGVEYLVAKKAIGSVFLPYLEPLSTLKALVVATASGLSANLETLLIDPAAWASERNIGQVILVGAGTGSSPTPPGPDSFASLGDALGTRVDGRLRIHATRDSLVQLNTATTDRASAAMLSSGAALALTTNGQVLNWILWPYVDPIAPVRMSRFAAFLAANTGLTAQDLLQAMRINGVRPYRSVLTAAYALIRKNRNLTSMSLYSGPSWRTHLADVLRVQSLGQPHFQHRMLAMCPRMHLTSGTGKDAAIGWIGTGDQDLKARRRLEAWHKAYRLVADNVGSLLLPHHGSRRNFRKEVLRFPNLRCAIVSAPLNSAHHPSSRVRRAALHANLAWIHTSEDPHSALSELGEVW